MRTVSQIGPERLGDFVAVAWTLRASDPLWVPPLREPLLRDLAGAGAFGRYGRQALFLCEDDGRPVGRVAAIVNPRLTDAAGAPLGQVGHFECVDDEGVARALLEAAFAWLRAAGAREVVGPMEGGAHRTHRFMTAGFERDPFLFELRNPAYYPRLFEANGFRRVHTWRSFDTTPAELRVALGGAGLAVAAVAARARRRYHIHALDPRDAAGTLARVHAILDRAWSGHIGYASFAFDEFLEVFGGVLALLDQEKLGMVVDQDGRDVGFALIFPDYVEEVRALAGSAAGWGRWTGEPRRRRLVWYSIAFAPEARGSGAPFPLIDAGLELLDKTKPEEVVIAMVTQEYKLFGRVLSPTREYALWGRRIDEGKS
ncbi:MAG: GNAT family N-acetyltransferase [Planctomycetes bacterium]|nr:GNAT family N-acetyltransferase [Planctomycetota bacterium]